ncbi:hypothetical protein HOB87_12740 [Candidatus Woesearchaeota archaeon]|jgi:hypothetical protein|nr:hypothetical protein [Candidatus Woesearchaeota archaeon]MBT7556159.1 hypothetical protein [Candidatus Woesearchaeota archaeon]
MHEKMELNNLNYFLLVYFYTIECDLNHIDNELKEIKFQSEEANTDEYLKIYFQKYISKNNNILNSNIEELELLIESKKITINVSDLSDYKITKVLLPSQITKEIKEEIVRGKETGSIYTKPDLILEISERENVYYQTLELKSTKGNQIPGSSVQQVTPFEWVVFVKRNENDVKISTGFYINSITESLPFPDRSPRPQIGFETLLKWNKKFRVTNGKKLSIKSDDSLNASKIKLIKDWQDFLAEEWLKIVISKDELRKEKWFNNAIRKFAVKFLEYTSSLSEEDKKSLKTQLNSFIKKRG